MADRPKPPRAQRLYQPFHSLSANQRRVDPTHWPLCQIPSYRPPKILPGKSIARSVHHMLQEQQPDQDQQVTLSIVLSHASQNPSHTRIVGTGLAPSVYPPRPCVYPVLLGFWYLHSQPLISNMHIHRRLTSYLSIQCRIPWISTGHDRDSTRLHVMYPRNMC